MAVLQFRKNSSQSARWIAVGLLAFVSVMKGDEGVEFFEKNVRPVLIEHCYSCHSGDAKELKGGLRLDLRAGWELGGESGEPAVVRGKPDESPLIRAVRHEDGVSAMPPKGARLPDQVIANLEAWVRNGARDPREGPVVPRDEAGQWETEFRRRLDWWSLQPVKPVEPPRVHRTDWPRTQVDYFVLSKLETAGLSPAREAEPQKLVRRLSLVLTGLPPTPQLVDRFLANRSPHAFDELVNELLESPHFGERWARHWMDVVHYADTHGYEWDVPAKNAWRYRDYLVRAFNDDIPFRQLVLEQMAGDLLEPRIDPATGINEALIGPMMLRLGERRHGDNSATEGTTQEAVSNMIDTLGKAFLGTTLACAQCHDHKLDAVEQRDYYALAGMLMSTRFSARTVDTIDPNEACIERLRSIKHDLRQALGRLWLIATDLQVPGGVREKLQAIKADEKPTTAFPTSLAEMWKRSFSTPITGGVFGAERRRRIDANQANLTLLADFTRPDGDNGWRWDGFGMKHGLVADGELVIMPEGEVAVQHLLPAGRYTHVWSQRLAGSLQSPSGKMDPTKPITFSLESVSGKCASQSFIVDRALHPERLVFPDLAFPQWRTVTAGNFDSLEGTVDTAPRRVYFELATKSLNNYFPPRVGYGGASETETKDPRSWFGITRIYQHVPGHPPQDELARFAPLFDEPMQETDWSRRLTQLLRGAVERWVSGQCSSEDVRLLNEALQLKLLPHDLAASEQVAQLVETYRTQEKMLRPDRTVGSVAEWNEGRDERLGIRGSYTNLGDYVARGGVRFLSPTPVDPSSASSGRLEVAFDFVAQRNPLLARVYVNRIWHYVFGAGLVRTPDDFGHLGAPPSHPELLDWLARRFVEDGWSTKRLIRLLVTSAAWRQESIADSRATKVDPENQLWHHMPLRRLDAESIRDSMLAASGRLDATLYGPAIEPYRTAEDASKRLFPGPLDGNGRRSIYTAMTLMEPPRFLALFNQPIPKQTVGRRDETNAPDQALALLNDPFVIEMARYWSEQLVVDGAKSMEDRVRSMLETALSRPPRSDEVARLVSFVERSAELRGATGNLLNDKVVWQDAAHATFNLKEFIYVP